MLQCSSFRTTDLYAYAEEYQRMEIIIKRVEEAEKRNRGPHSDKGAEVPSWGSANTSTGRTLGSVSTSTAASRTTTTSTRPTPTASKPSNTLTKVKTSYNDPQKQELSKKGLCFTCEKPGYIAKDCPKDKKLAVIEELLDSEGLEKA